jgi:hypothetical protein
MNFCSVVAQDDAGHAASRIMWTSGAVGIGLGDDRGSVMTHQDAMPATDGIHRRFKGSVQG